MNIVPQYSGRFYAAHPDLAQACDPAVLPDRLQPLLLSVTRHWNAVLIPGTLDPNGEQFWKICKPGDTAICHDYVATKLADLVARGVSRGALSIAMCQRFESDELHVVLLARFADTTYVLDSLSNDLVAVSYDDDRRWISRETWGQPNNWEAMS